jgi:endogenous inhibitor of DNA gyrase (YacG/DUF329 family)
MIPLRYSWIRWVIFAIGVALAAYVYLFLPPLGIQVLVYFLLILTAMSWIVPPGIYGWLVHAICPTCKHSVEWEAVQPEGEPYREQIVRRCPECGKSIVEWQSSPA